MDGGKINAITKRDLERKLDLQRRKHDKDSLTADNEKFTFFEASFFSQRAQIEKLLASSRKLDKRQLPDHFNFVSKEIILLQKYVATSNIFLRSYDIKKYQQSIQDLTHEARELEEELMPKKKFGFKNRHKAKVPEKKIENGKDEVDFQMKNQAITKQLCGFADKNGESLVMKGADMYKKDVSVENLENCKVSLFGCPSTLHLSHLNNCYVFTGPVSTSIFAENCTNCTLVIACQQLRLHSSNNVNIYLHVTSRAIMEDCREIHLAPYNLQYPGLDEDFKQAGLDQSLNNWKSVDDFNWLNVKKQSPNWSLLDEKLITSNWNNL